MNKFGTLLFAVSICLPGCRTPQTVIRSANPVQTVSFQSETTFESGSIEEFVQLGLSRNPRIQEAQHKIAATRYRVPQALSLPDPMVQTNTYLAPVQTAAGEQAFSLGISQKFINSKKRETQAAMVSDEAAVAEAELVQVQLEIAESIRSACYQLLFIRKSIEITNEDRESLERIADVVLRQYEVKKSVTQQDVLNVQVEQSRIENQISELSQKERSYQARLARLLHVDSKSTFQIVDQLKADSQNLDLDSLIAQATQSRPDLQSQLAKINRGQKKVHLAQLEEKPDFTVGLNWIATSSSGISPIANGEDALLLGVGFNLPIYKSRIRAGICEARSDRLAAESRLDSLQDQAAEEVFDLVAKLESTSDTLKLVQEDILPKADRTLELSMDEYATGSTEYVQLIANWRSVLRYRIAEANLQSQYQGLLASLARSVGQLEPISTMPIDSTVNQPALELESSNAIDGQ